MNLFPYFVVGAVASDAGITWSVWECVHWPSDWFGYALLFLFVGAAIVCAVSGAMLLYAERIARGSGRRA